MKISITSSTNVQQVIQPTFLNQCPIILLPPLFQRTSQPQGHDEQA